MDLSLKNVITESFDYRHKKFDHIRTSPNQFEETRSLAGTPTSSCYESDFYRITQANVKHEQNQKDFIWQKEMDQISIPSTPIKKPRISKRKFQNIVNVLQNAPKKQKLEEPITPIKPTTTTKSTPTTPTKIPAYTTSNLMPKISNDALARICQYNKNMVRKFPKKERSAKDQERRDKNTIACRMSRRLKKLENLATEEQYKIFVQQHFEQQKRSIHATVYLNELIKTGAEISPAELNDEFIHNTAKSLNLKYLESCLVKNKKSIEEKVQKSIKVIENVKHLRSVKNDNFLYKPENKRLFTIDFLLGNEQK